MILLFTEKLNRICTEPIALIYATSCALPVDRSKDFSIKAAHQIYLPKLGRAEQMETPNIHISLRKRVCVELAFIPFDFITIFRNNSLSFSFLGHDASKREQSLTKQAIFRLKASSVCWKQTLSSKHQSSDEAKSNINVDCGFSESDEQTFSICSWNQFHQFSIKRGLMLRSGRNFKQSSY